MLRHYLNIREFQMLNIIYIIILVSIINNVLNSGNTGWTVINLVFFVIVIVSWIFSNKMKKKIEDEPQTKL